MASQQPPAAAAAAAASPPTPQVVANAFVHQYYHILHQSPEFVHRFYQEGSKLGRPEPQGAMISVTTMQAIDKKILSTDYSEIRAEIKNVDAQESFQDGVLVLVTGYLTGKDNVRRNFTQSFFLAPQDKGYYVLNDIFRYVEDADHPFSSQVAVPKGVGATPSPEQETPPPQEAEVMQRSELPHEEDEEEEAEEDEEEVIDEELYNASVHAEVAVVEEDEEFPVEEVINEVPIISPPPIVTDSSLTPVVQEEAPKKSYASIVKVKKENAAPPSAPAPAPARLAPVKPERQAAPALTPAPTPEPPTASSNSTETSSIQEAEADGHSIYIKNLPLTATDVQLEVEFKKFGPIKPNGIQVRSHKQQGFCFGFVEFEVASAVQSAIEASPITIGGRQAYIEEKRPAGSRVRRFVPGRGGFWNDGGRGRGGYVGRGYGRGDYSNRGDFGGRGGGRGGAPNRGGDGGYQRVDSMGSSGGRGNRPGSAGPPNTSPRNFVPRVPAPA